MSEVVHNQAEIDEFLSTTLYGLLKCPDEDSVSYNIDPEELRNKIEFFMQKQMELKDVYFSYVVGTSMIVP